MRPIYLPIETKNREYPAKLLLAAELVRNGATVLLGKRGELHRMLPFLTPGVLVEKGIGFTGYPKYLRAIQRGHLIVGWDEEGLVFDARRYTFALDERILSLFSRFFAWGEVHGDLLRSEQGNLGHSVIPSGNPRMDVMSRYWKYSKPQRPLLLFSDNFALANHFQGPDYLRTYLEKYVWSHPRRSDSEKREQEAIMRQLLRNKKLLLEKFLSCVRKTSSTFPGASVILRPHPSSNTKFLLESTSDLDNVTITADGPVEKWISRSTAVVHSGCTVGLQSFVIGAPTLAIEDADVRIEGEWLPNALSDSSLTIDDLLSKLEAHMAEAHSKTARAERTRKFALLRQHVSALSMCSDGEIVSDSVPGIVEEILEVASVDMGGTAKPRTTKRARMGDIWSYMEVWIRRSRSDYSRQKFPELAEAEIARDLADLGMPNVAISAVSGGRGLLYRLELAQ